jgi:hypothetical protein
MVRMIDVASVVGHLLSDATVMVTDNLIEMHPDMVSQSVGLNEVLRKLLHFFLAHNTYSRLLAVYIMPG